MKISQYAKSWGFNTRDWPFETAIMTTKHLLEISYLSQSIRYLMKLSADHLANMCTNKNSVKDDVTPARVKSYKYILKQTILQISFKEMHFAQS